jgi:hypothetical protein
MRVAVDVDVGVPTVVDTGVMVVGSDGDLQGDQRAIAVPGSCPGV